jgi:hypothetical protein
VVSRHSFFALGRKSSIFSLSSQEKRNLFFALGNKAQSFACTWDKSSILSLASGKKARGDYGIKHNTELLKQC